MLLNFSRLFLLASPYSLISLAVRYLCSYFFLMILTTFCKRTIQRTNYHHKLIVKDFSSTTFLLYNSKTNDDTIKMYMKCIDHYKQNTKYFRKIQRLSAIIPVLMVLNISENQKKDKQPKIYSNGSWKAWKWYEQQ